MTSARAEFNSHLVEIFFSFHSCPQRRRLSLSVGEYFIPPFRCFPSPSSYDEYLSHYQAQQSYGSCIHW